jgi:glyceraldehyde 3-phosphate dehydrogenase
MVESSGFSAQIRGGEVSIRVGINGFGRIGRLVVRAARKQGLDVDLVAVNDLTDARTLAHLLKYDSVHGLWPGEVKEVSGGISFEGDTMKVFAEKDPANLPWRDLGVEIVVESTGRFTDRAGASKHLEAGRGPRR